MKKVMLLASEDMCDILRTALDDKYRTLPCSDPADGRAVLQEEPDALILELFLPGSDGLTFLKESHQLPPAVFVLTPWIRQELLEELTALGVKAVFLIPCSLSYLVGKLAEQL